MGDEMGERPVALGCRETAEEIVGRYLDEPDSPLAFRLTQAIETALQRAHEADARLAERIGDGDVARAIRGNRPAYLVGDSVYAKCGHDGWYKCDIEAVFWMLDSWRYRIGRRFVREVELRPLP